LDENIFIEDLLSLSVSNECGLKFLLLVTRLLRRVAQSNVYATRAKRCTTRTHARAAKKFAQRACARRALLIAFGARARTRERTLTRRLSELHGDEGASFTGTIARSRADARRARISPR
jgi:hypothetical protein